MTIVVRLHFDGKLDRSDFEQAYTAALIRHPLMQARVTKTRSLLGRSQWSWTIQTKNTFGDIQGPLAWSLGSRSPFCSEFIDLHSDLSSKATITGDEDSPLLTLQLHHAAADGQGVTTFLRDLLLGYATRRNGSPFSNEFPPIDADKLQKRGSYGIHLRNLFRIVLTQLSGGMWAARYVVRKPAPAGFHEDKRAAQLRTSSTMITA